MPQYRVGDIDAPELATIPSDENLLDAIDEMFSERYHQIGVDRNGELIGMLSFQSLARAIKVVNQVNDSRDIAGRSVEIAVEEPVAVVDPDEDVFTLFDLLAEDFYVLVEYPGEEYHIITDWDLHNFLQEELEDFLLIAEIEDAIRSLFRRAYPHDLPDRLADAFDDMEIPTPDTVEHCSFSHYQIFISKNDADFEHYFDEDPSFAESLLGELGDIRNRLFHFRGEEEPEEGDRVSDDKEFVRYAHGYFTAIE